MRRRRILEGLLFSLVSALAYGVGCASRPDWIEQTLVTVDVTGTWVGSEITGYKSGPGMYEVALEQQGAKVRGYLQRHGEGVGQAAGTYSGPVEGTVGGDVFRFRQTNGSLTGETALSGDEMAGEVSFDGLVRRITLRRVDSRVRPMQGR